MSEYIDIKGHPNPENSNSDKPAAKEENPLLPKDTRPLNAPTAIVHQGKNDCSIKQTILVTAS